MSTAVIPGVAGPAASTLAVQNLVQLCKDLKLPVTYKAHEVVSPGSKERTFRMVVHVHSDHAFKKYLATCAMTDLMLYRGLLLTVTTDPEVQHVLEAHVQQAFLPKFENEGQDSSIADEIVKHADERFMVVTIKHSGSLVTLSSEGFAAKNSVGNEYTGGAALLLRAHFDRLHGVAQGSARLAEFMALLRARRMAVSFEMVTACHGHHGQLPAGEYLVATAAHVEDPAAGRPTFLGWQDFLTFCLEQGLPVNDTWLFQGRQWAASARTLLDDLSLSGGITAIALHRLNHLVQEGASVGCLHVRGTYPHDQWQGSRLEGFVVAQGQPISEPVHRALKVLSERASQQVISLPQVPPALRTPYKAMTEEISSQVAQGPAGAPPSSSSSTAAATTVGDNTSAAAAAAVHAAGASKGGKAKSGKSGAAQPASAPKPSGSTRRPAKSRQQAAAETAPPPAPPSPPTPPSPAPPPARPTSATGPAPGPAADPAGPPAQAALPAGAVVNGGSSGSAAGAEGGPQRPGSGRGRGRPLNAAAPIFASALRNATASAAAAAAATAGAAASTSRPAATAAANQRQPPAATSFAAAAKAGADRQASASNARQPAATNSGRRPTSAVPVTAGAAGPSAGRQRQQPVPATANAVAAATHPAAAPPPAPASPQAPLDVVGPLTGKARDVLLERISGLQGAWLPHPEVASVEAALREKIITCLLAFKAPEPLVQLPNGSLMFIRTALGSAPPAQAAASLEAAYTAITQQRSLPQGSPHPAPDARAVRELVEQVAARGGGKGGKEGGKEVVVEGEAVPLSNKAKAPRIVLGAPELGNALRYKKKMLMWRVGRATTATTTIIAAAGGPSDASLGPAPMETSTSVSMETEGPGGSAGGAAITAPSAAAGAAAPSAAGGGGGGGGGMNGALDPDLERLSGVGYCLMTFVIRNGMAALRLGLQQYMSYVNHLARGWGLPEQHVAQINMFARAWAAWVARHGGVNAIKDYLHTAEPFVEHFLACMAAGDVAALTGQKAKGSFQGILVLLHEPDMSKAKSVQGVLGADNLIDMGQSGKKAQCPPFSKSLVTQGTVIVCPPGQPLHRDLPALITAAGPSAFCAVVRSDGAGDYQAAKRMSGVAETNRSRIEQLLGASEPPRPASSRQGQAGLNGSNRMRLLDAVYRPQEVAGWLGEGVPLAKADPAAICCFISIPGVGKTVLTNALSTLPGMGSTPVTLKVLNSDKMKKNKAFQPSRYWHDVACAADTNQGNGAVSVVVADKNLVPSPPGNIQRAAVTISDSGAVTVAVVPSWRGTPQTDIGVSYPDLPFPLELVALCMLRTLLRKNHEGNLDASLNTAMTVVMMFATFYKDRSRTDLMELVKGQFAVVAEMPVMDLDASDPNKQVPIKLLRLLAEGLSSFNDRAKHQLPDSWERNVRAELMQPATQQRLLSLQTPMADCQQALGLAIVQGLRAAQTLDAQGGPEGGPGAVQGLAAAGIAGQVAAAAAGAAGGKRAMDVDDRPPKWIAVSGVNPASLHDVVHRLLPNLDLKQLKSEFHVTLWHGQDPEMGRDQGMRDELMAARGTTVDMQVVSVDHMPDRITAAQVQLLNAPEVAFSKPYHHITLAICLGTAAKDANQLPSWVEAGAAQRIELEEPVPLSGVVAGFM